MTLVSKDAPDSMVKLHLPFAVNVFTMPLLLTSVGFVVLVIFSLTSVWMSLMFDEMENDMVVVCARTRPCGTHTLVRI